MIFFNFCILSVLTWKSIYGEFLNFPKALLNNKILFAECPITNISRTYNNNKSINLGSAKWIKGFKGFNFQL